MIAVPNLRNGSEPGRFLAKRRAQTISLVNLGKLPNNGKTASGLSGAARRSRIMLTFDGKSLSAERQSFALKDRADATDSIAWLRLRRGTLSLVSHSCT
jgi:hypothetical protein